MEQHEAQKYVRQLREGVARRPARFASAPTPTALNRSAQRLNASPCSTLGKTTKTKTNPERVAALAPLETRILRFAMKRKLKTDLPSRLKKLGEEFGELAEAIANNDADAIEKEAADCAIILTHICIIRARSLQHAMAEKLTEVESRHIWNPSVKIKGLYECSRCGCSAANPTVRKHETCPA